MKHVYATELGNSAQSLICCMLPRSNQFFSKATKWGCEHETSANADIMEDVHPGFACKESGLVVSNIHPFH